MCVCVGAHQWLANVPPNVCGPLQATFHTNKSARFCATSSLPAAIHEFVDDQIDNTDPLLPSPPLIFIYPRITNCLFTLANSIYPLLPSFSSFSSHFRLTEATSKSCTEFWRATISVSALIPNCKHYGSRHTTSKRNVPVVDRWVPLESTGFEENIHYHEPYGTVRRRHTVLRKSPEMYYENGTLKIHTHHLGRNET